MTLTLTFLGLAAVIIVAAMFLAKFADGLSEQTGLGKSVTGLVLLAGVTSLPEFSIGYSAIRMGAADLTAGDVLGSSLLNLFLLAVLDMASRTPGRILSRRAVDHAMAAAVACVMTAVVLLGILLDSEWTFLRLGASSWGLIITYIICTRMLFRDHRSAAPSQIAAEHVLAHAGESSESERSLAANILGFVVCGAVIFFIAPKLAHTADQLAVTTGLGRTFFGTVFVATMTSLPEAVSTFSSIRLKNFDMAIGNILGSNSFNMLILGVMDLASPKPVLSLVADVHAITAACVLLTTCVTILCLVYRSEKKWWVIEPDALLVILLVIGSMYLVFLNR